MPPEDENMQEPDKESYEAWEQAQQDRVIREVEFSSQENVDSLKLTFKINVLKKYIFLEQGSNVIAVDRFQALELAKELLNYREWLKVCKPDDYTEAFENCKECGLHYPVHRSSCSELE